MLEKSRDETHHSTYSYNAESSTNYCNQYNQSSDFVSNKTFIDPPFKSIIPRYDFWSNGPAGLEFLDRILVEPAHYFHIGTDKKYALKNNSGQLVFHAYEDSDACMRTCWCSCVKRGFDVVMVDTKNTPVMKLSKRFKCLGEACCWCAGSCTICTHDAIVEAPIGFPIGSIKQKRTAFKPEYIALDENRKELFTLEGPYSHCFLNGIFCPKSDGFKFKMYSPHSRVQLGIVGEQYPEVISLPFISAGFGHSPVNNAYGVSFIPHLDVKTKSMMIAAFFFIDLMHFGDKTQKIASGQ